MDYFLFFLYLIITGFLVTSLNFYQQSGLSKISLVGFYLFRVLIAMAGCYLALHYLKNADSPVFQNFGNEDYRLLFTNPREYFQDLFPKSSIDHTRDFIVNHDSYWNDLRSILLIKFISILNIFSNCNFYVNTLLFNFLIFSASVGLYRMMQSVSKENKWAIILTLFFLPSFLYFSAALHRDGLLFILIVAVVGSFSKILNRKISLRYLIFFFVGLILILLIRNFVFLMLLPALFAWSIAHQKPRHSLRIFGVVYFVCLILFFGSSLFPGKYNLLQYVTSKQSEFIELSKDANTTLPFQELEPSFWGFIKNFPEAVNHAIFQPYVTQIMDLKYLPFILEVILLILIFAGVLFFRKPAKSISPFLYFLFFFSISMLLVIGYTIPIFGALARYRSIYFPLLFLALIPFIDLSKVRKSIYDK